MTHPKKVLVTGGTSGIGLAIAQRFARDGHDLVLIGSNPTRDYGSAVREVRAAAEEVGCQPNVMAHGVDITDFAAVKKLMAHIHDEVGTFDVLVHSAGVFFDTPITDENPDAFVRMMNVNVNGMWHIVQAALPYMRRKMGQVSGGKIVAISSISGFYGFANYSGYSASKAAVTSLTRSLALELGPLGININAVEPGRVKTSMHDALLSDPAQENVLREIAASNPSGRAFTTPEDISNVVAFLASEGAIAMHGASLVVDEGTTLGIVS
ncbi:SDR family NAD(P)-dependent oxidoreductase [Saccharibacter floricola]|uniref:Short-chain dehydrogenase n=1 Tax=Saccharibacter floricola DSM 15669 TaxID=1123227 RepID=A0ABQ0NWW8_9PROT|nr:SDR family oxidoreductase [Saccharibacter floricola]GBQ05126.1 short-chain dehydrogenase [Saccharibacter floricola DSM 15669]